MRGAGACEPCASGVSLSPTEHEEGKESSAPPGRRSEQGRPVEGCPGAPVAPTDRPYAAEPTAGSLEAFQRRSRRTESQIELSKRMSSGTSSIAVVSGSTPGKADGDHRDDHVAEPAVLAQARGRGDPEPDEADDEDRKLEDDPDREQRQEGERVVGARPDLDVVELPVEGRSGSGSRPGARPCSRTRSRGRAGRRRRRRAPRRPAGPTGRAPERGSSRTARG